MNRRGEKQGARARLALACAAILLVSCERQPRAAIDGVVVFEDFIQLERGKTLDTARREFTAPADGTFVGIIEENDINVQLQLERFGSGAEPVASITVESRLTGEGIEVAALEIKRGDRLALVLEDEHEFSQPGRVRVKLLRYDGNSAAQAAVRARVQAYLNWAAATAADMTSDGMRATGYRDLDAALQYFESRDGDPGLAAWARLVRANLSYDYYLDMKAALADARLAERAFSKLGDARGAARARLVQAIALLEISVDAKSTDPTPEEAHRDSERILRDLENNASLSARERARMTLWRGEHAYYLKDLPEAKRLGTLALAGFRAIGDLEGTRTMLANLGVYAGESGDWQEQLRVCAALFPHIGEIRRPERRAVYIFNDAYVHMSVGNTDLAIERWLLLLKEARQFKLPLEEANALDGLGRSYWQRGDLAQAAVFVDEARRVRAKVEDPGAVMVNLSLAGSIARDAGDTQKAVALHRQSLELAPTNDSRMRGLANVARDLAEAGDYDQAITSYRAALAVPQSPPIPWRMRTVGFYLAESLLARKGRSARDVDEALALAEKGLQGAIADGDISQEQVARKVLAQARAARGDLAEAQREYERAVALIFRYRAMSASPEQQAAVLTRMQATFRGYTDLLMRNVVAKGPGQPRAVSKSEENALRVLEAARLISFDAVRLARVDDATQGRIDQLLGQMAAKRVILASLLDRSAVPTPAIQALQLEIADLRTRIDSERVRAGIAKPGELLPQEITRPWPALAAGVTQLSYALGEHGAYLWMRDASGIRATVLPASPAEIERELELLAAKRRTAESGDSAHDLARISAWLLPEGAIAPGSSRLEIVAEGKLASLPFAALGVAEDRTRRLAESHSIVMIGSTLDSSDRGPVRGAHAMRLVALAGFAGPAPVLAKRGLFPTLGSTGAEARAIVAMFAPVGTAPDVKLLTGNAGSAEAVKAAWAKGTDVLHFATHGLADLRQPLASLLMLPAVDSTGNATYLTAGQVQSWRGDADLVYLSACETAVGPARFADGMPGLQRAFLRAGARGVIATLWPIEDMYASQFATQFYKRYIAGMSAAQALSETQRAWLTPVAGLRDVDQARRHMTAWAHVYYTR